MSRYWEFQALTWAFVAIVAYIVGEFIFACWKDYRRWKAVRPYYGKPYDASQKMYRPNVDLRRTR